MRAWLIIILLIPALALAAPPDADKQARTHYQAAQRFFAAGDYDQAIAEYRQAYELTSRPRLLYNIGSAFRRKAQRTGALDDRRSAVEHYRRYLEAEPTGKGADDARAYLAELEAEIAASEPRPPPPTPEPAPAPEPAPEPPVAPTPPPPETDARPGRSGAAFRIGGIASAGVGVGLLALGVYFGLRVRSINDDLAALDGEWSQSLYDSGVAAERNMYISLGAGAAAIAAGAVFYFVFGRDRPPETVTILPGPSPTGLTVVGRF